jgi:hypothetical protein
VNIAWAKRWRVSRPTFSLWGLLWILGLADLWLTDLALRNVPGAVELNWLPSWAFIQGVPAAIGLKLFSLVLVLALSAQLERSHPRATQWTLGGWCFVLLAVDAYSVVQLRVAGVL